MTTITEPAIARSSKSSVRPLLDIRNVAKSFGKNPVLRDISLQIAEGEFLTILGESGSGKTTLLRIIAGFESADSGEIFMEGERQDLLPPYRRRVNPVFQQYALFPHLSVEDNVAYGLRVAKLPKAEIAENNYDLSLNRYKEVVHEESPHRSPRDILAALARLEAEIQDGMKELGGMLK